jgi:transcriptional regulator with XRE-family HTH domain
LYKIASEAMTMGILSDRTVALRESKGWTQAVLAKEAGVPQPTISRIEGGKMMPRGDTLQKVAKALGTTVSHLLGETDGKVS